MNLQHGCVAVPPVGSGPGALVAMLRFIAYIIITQLSIWQQHPGHISDGSDVDAIRA
jgi:hypothetical protein